MVQMLMRGRFFEGDDAVQMPFKRGNRTWRRKRFTVIFSKEDFLEGQSSYQWLNGALKERSQRTELRATAQMAING